MSTTVERDERIADALRRRAGREGRLPVVAVIAMAEVARQLRFLNAALGLWLVIAPWVLDGATTGSAVNDVILGLALIALSLPRGRVRETYGGWDRYVR